MPTLINLCEEPDFCLRFVNGGPMADRAVDSVRALSLAAAAGGSLGDVRDALVVIGDFWASGRTSVHEGSSRCCVSCRGSGPPDSPWWSGSTARSPFRW